LCAELTLLNIALAALWIPVCPTLQTEVVWGGHCQTLLHPSGVGRWTLPHPPSPPFPLPLPKSTADYVSVQRHILLGTHLTPLLPVHDILIRDLGHPRPEVNHAVASQIYLSEVEPTGRLANGRHLHAIPVGAAASWW